MLAVVVDEPLPAAVVQLPAPMPDLAYYSVLPISPVQFFLESSDDEITTRTHNS